MISLLSIFFIKYLFFAPLVGFCTIYGAVGFSKAFYFSLEKINTLKVGLLFTLFYLSIYLFFKNPLPFSPVQEAIKELVSSILLGPLWTWIFLGLMDGFGYSCKKVKKLTLVYVFSVIAFGIFTLMR